MFDSPALWDSVHSMFVLFSICRTDYFCLLYYIFSIFVSKMFQLHSNGYNYFLLL